MSCLPWNHNYGRPHRAMGYSIDLQTCTECGHERVSKAQIGGHWRPGVTSKPIFTDELEREIEYERQEIRRKEAFWQ